MYECFYFSLSWLIFSKSSMGIKQVPRAKQWKPGSSRSLSQGSPPSVSPVLSSLYGLLTKTSTATPSRLGGSTYAVSGNVVIIDTYIRLTVYADLYSGGTLILMAQCCRSLTFETLIESPSETWKRFLRSLAHYAEISSVAGKSFHLLQTSYNCLLSTDAPPPSAPNSVHDGPRATPGCNAHAPPKNGEVLGSLDFDSFVGFAAENLTSMPFFSELENMTFDWTGSVSNPQPSLFQDVDLNDNSIIRDQVE